MIRLMLVALFLSPVALAQDATPSKTQVVLIDGTTIYASIGDVVFEVQTKFGTLKIPAKDVTVATFGYNLTEEEQTKVKDSVKKLGSGVWKERDAATAYLDRLGERAYPCMPETVEVGDAEVQKRLESWHTRHKPSKELLFDYFDSDDGRIKGKIQNKTFKISHDILGELSIDVAKIKTIANMVSMTMTVAPDQDWKVVCKIPHMSKVRVTAVGTIDLWPQTPGQYVSTPKGHATQGKGGQFKAGALIGRIDGGPEFVVGDEKEINPSLLGIQSGTLLLRIVENPWNGVSAGSYSVRIDRR
jgi:hypothetical protein